ncbi:hypothetical protein HanPI659440_Chr07g0264001 [Helianthus annuus]|nr:hypothetical protein HanPI659440_Chr07g0264001 [Helianthus annuus]
MVSRQMKYYLSLLPLRLVKGIGWFLIQALCQLWLIYAFPRSVRFR